MTFRVAVSKIVEPFLKAHGFVAEIRKAHRVLFSREYRGYPNSVDIEHAPMGLGTRAVRFGLITPKCPYPGHIHFQGYPLQWEANTPEELVTGLTEIREALAANALDWFEIYTPGNVPPWEERVTAEIVPLLAQYGFARDTKWYIYDWAKFTHHDDPNRMVILNLKVPGRIGTALYYHLPGQKEVVKRFAYANEEEFYKALVEIRDYLQAAVPPWMEREPI